MPKILYFNKFYFFRNIIFKTSFLLLCRDDWVIVYYWEGGRVTNPITNPNTNPIYLSIRIIKPNEYIRIWTNIEHWRGTYAYALEIVLFFPPPIICPFFNSNVMRDMSKIQHGLASILRCNKKSCSNRFFILKIVFLTNKS